MERVRRVSAAGLGAAAILLTAINAVANPIPLGEEQLDRVTAGGGIVLGSSDAQATGALAITATTSNSFVTQGTSPYPGNPQLGVSAVVADGTALAVGSNVTAQNQPPPSSSTAVTTGGIADGNLIFGSTVNQTVQGAGGVQFQAGWTFVYGSWSGL